MVLCVAHIHDLCLTLTLTFDLNIKSVYFHHEFDLARSSLLFDIAYQFWYMGVLPGDNMLCTFLTFV